jgi:hypothetical protein
MLALLNSKHKVASMNSGIHQQERPTRRQAGGALLRVDAWHGDGEPVEMKIELEKEAAPEIG